MQVDDLYFIFKYLNLKLVSVCAAGWELFEHTSKCYKYFDAPKSSEEAQKHCEYQAVSNYLNKSSIYMDAPRD